MVLFVILTTILTVIRLRFKFMSFGGRFKSIQLSFLWIAILSCVFMSQKCSLLITTPFASIGATTAVAKAGPSV